MKHNTLCTHRNRCFLTIAITLSVQSLSTKRLESELHLLSERIKLAQTEGAGGIDQETVASCWSSLSTIAKLLQEVRWRGGLSFSP